MCARKFKGEKGVNAHAAELRDGLRPVLPRHRDRDVLVLGEVDPRRYVLAVLRLSKNEQLIVTIM